MARKIRRAFTLVEMLVVIAIIGMLMAMVLPAVQQAIEMARANTCRNNMKQLGYAMLSLAEQRGEFPGYVNRVGQPSSDDDETTIKMATWVVKLMPHMGRNAAWDLWNSGLPMDDMQITFIDNLVCPSDHPEGLRLAQLSYVVNCGRQDSNSRLSRDQKANGIFHNHYRSTTNENRIPTTKVTTAYIETADGVTNTMMISENIQAKNWTVQDPEFPGQYDANGYNDSHKMEKHVGFIWHASVPSIRDPRRSDGYSAQMTINGLKDLISEAEPNENRYARPSCHHGGGVNVVMCDSSAHFVRESIDYEVLRQLMTPYHKKSDAPDNGQNPRIPLHLLNDNDWK